MVKIMGEYSNKKSLSLIEFSLNPPKIGKISPKNAIFSQNLLFFLEFLERNPYFSRTPWAFGRIYTLGSYCTDLLWEVPLQVSTGLFCFTPVETDGELVETELGVVEPVLGAEDGLGGGEGENSRVPQSEYRGHCGQ